MTNNATSDAGKTDKSIYTDDCREKTKRNSNQIKRRNHKSTTGTSTINHNEMDHSHRKRPGIALANGGRERREGEKSN